ncbi:MAG: hypothetical protein GEV07_07660 [Streptosporangiales bacterium]|nr:hypothetical protein [Streptosporangiales bacterium]
MGRRQKESIRAVALAVAAYADRVFLFEGEDPSSGELYYRPIGGAIAFGERAIDTARRVVERDMSTELIGIRALGVLENIYDHGGYRQHEICFVFAGAFADRQVYEHDTVELTEGDQVVALGGWQTLGSLDAPGAPAVLPKGLLAMLRSHHKAGA